MAMAARKIRPTRAPELNATQRLFEALTGRSMRLFRPPYLGDAEPSDADEIVPVQIAQNLGYITVGTHVDTLDWMMPSVPKYRFTPRLRPDVEEREKVNVAFNAGALYGPFVTVHGGT